MPQTTQVADTPGLDPTLPDIVLRLGGVERHLCFDFNAIVQAEKVTGLNLLTAIVSDIDAIKLRGLLWAALLKEYPSLTIEEAGAFINGFNAPVIYSALIATWFGSVSEDESSGEPTASPKQKAQAKTKA